MTARITTILFTLIILFTGLSLAQEEKLSADDILKWFPMATYESIIHVDSEAVEKESSYETFKKMTGNYDYSRFYLPLPPTLMKKWSSFTLALKVKLLVYERTGSGRKGKRNAGKMAAMYMGDTTYAAESTGYYLGVYRYADLDSFIKQAEKAGEVQSTDDHFDKRTIYKTSAKIMDREASLYLYPSIFQELLVCEDLSLLKQMIAVGYGSEPNILDDQEFTEFADIVPDLGQCWNWKTFNLHFRVILNKAEKEGAPQDEIDKQRKRSEQRAQWKITSHVLGKEFIQQEFEYFIDDEHSKSYYDRMKNFVYTEKITSQAWYRLQLNAKKYEHDGNFVIATIRFTKDLVDNIQAESEKARKLRQEKKKKDQKDK